MPDAYFIPHANSDEGFSEPGSTNVDHQTFHWNWFGNDGWGVGRYFITRFANVDIPVGATISAASVIYTMNAKSPGNAQTVNYDHYFEATAVGGGTVRQDCTPLRENVSEESTAQRTWTKHVTNAVFNWPSSPAGTYNPLSVDVTSLLQQAWTINGGRHMSLAFMIGGLAESDDLAVGNTASKRPVQLKITYSGGTAANEVATFNENGNFTLGTVTEDGGLVRPNLYLNNGFFGSFDSTPTYQVMASDGAIVAPWGGNIVKITSTVAKNTAIFTFPVPAGNNAYGPTRQVLTPGEWVTISGWVYIPAGSTIERVRAVTSPSVATTSFNFTKGSWQRVYSTYQYLPDQGYWTGFRTDDSAPTIGQFWYLANVNVTRTRELYPYFDGDIVDSATYHRTYDWGGGTTGRRSGGIGYATLDAKPTVTPSVNQPPASTYDSFAIWWDYSDPYSDALTRSRVEIRKKRVP